MALDLMRKLCTTPTEQQAHPQKVEWHMSAAKRRAVGGQEVLDEALLH